jgi:hypothetical protein
VHEYIVGEKKKKKRAMKKMRERGTRRTDTGRKKQVRKFSHRVTVLVHSRTFV